MKTLKISLVAAIALAISALTFSFRAVDSVINEKVSMHWYLKDTNGDYQYEGYLEEAPTECNGSSGEICAKGFEEGTPVPNPILDTSTADDTRQRNP